MIRHASIFAAAAVLASPALAQTPPENPPVPPQTAPTLSPESQTRSAVLELAGAFSNDGFKIRDGFWYATVEPGKPQILEVNLFAGNEYWFCVAGTVTAQGISVEVYDDKGALPDQETYADAATAAAGVVASYSGPYYVKVTLPEGEKSPFCLVYCYK